MFFFLIIDLCFLIPAINFQVFNTTAELEIPRKTPTHETKAEIEKYPLIAERKVKKCPK